jgi:hypothetical protein
MKRHGEKYTKTFKVNQGQSVYTKNMQYCVVHGEIDLFLFPDFQTKHAFCDRKPRHGAFAEPPKAMRKAA